MAKNYQEKHKAYLDGLVRDKLNQSRGAENMEQKSSKLVKLKRFACTLDFESKPGETTGSK